jgi:hypothetical protein
MALEIKLTFLAKRNLKGEYIFYSFLLSEVSNLLHNTTIIGSSVFLFALDTSSLCFTCMKCFKYAH